MLSCVCQLTINGDDDDGLKGKKEERFVLAPYCEKVASEALRYGSVVTLAYYRCEV